MSRINAMRNDHHRSNPRPSRPVHRGDARLGAWGLAVTALFGAAAATALSGCVSDPDCGVCDPENLILESVAGSNYAGKTVKILGPQCEGDACPGPIEKGQYFVDKIIPCVETEEALASPRGVDEFCMVSPLIVTDGLQLIFNNLLDPQSVELVRKSPVNPQLFEVYDWKNRVVHLEGPITRYNGDYRRAASQSQPDRMTRLVSLSCIDNLQDVNPGDPFDHEDLVSTVCDGTFVDPETKLTWPLKTRLGQEVKAGSGEADHRSVANSCTTPQDGADTCCDACDYDLAVNVAKYGVVKPLGELAQASLGDKRSPNPGAGGPALKCDPMGDKFRDCADFIPHVYRGEEVRNFSYDWNGDGKVDPEKETFRVPRQDKLRETFPSERPTWLEQKTVPCNTRSDCAADPGPNLTGMDCVGELEDGGGPCTTGDDCVDKRCVAEWFVECRTEEKTTGDSTGYCVDKRWSGQGVAACFTPESNFAACADEACTSYAGNVRPGQRFAYGDVDTDNFISAVEGCRSNLGSGADDKAACDPLMQSGIKPIDRYDRKETLPSVSRKCVCEDQPEDGCADLVTKLCRENGDPDADIIESKKGQYALKFVSKTGGVIYDPAIKGVLFLPADLGAMPRSFTERCSATRASGAGALNIKDGWRANDNGFFESFENFDRAMCSSSEYKIRFSTPEDGENNPVQYIRDKVGNVLTGKSTYVIRTPDFHVVPGSGFPTDNLRIGACDDFEIRFSNKYDMSPVNVGKLQIVALVPQGDDYAEGELIAGGIGCAPNKAAIEAGEGSVPCLTTNVRDQEIGSIRVEIDAKEFGAILKPGQRYRLKVPGISLAYGETVHDAMKDAERYKNAFWDACGMPLVVGMPELDAAGKVVKNGTKQKPDYVYDFSIDSPKCKEDKDLDNYQFSCDNAPDTRNPDQRDVDGDGFGDVIDLCPTLFGEINTGDTDKDAIGNACDLCSRLPDAYNTNAEDAMAPAYMLVRNIPDQSDFDGDGIGDVCDNCIVVPNCGDFGEGEPDGRASIGDAVPVTDDNVCQVDKQAGTPFVGDACTPGGTPVELEGAAGPVGLGPTDDFDQDGIANMPDLCPRQRVPSCTESSECGGEVQCVGGKCENHVDTDEDGVGDACDNCPYKANPKQIQDGVMQEDDADGDYVGQCETNIECSDRADPRPVAFYTKRSPSGMCCTTIFEENTIDAPRLNAEGEALTYDEVQAILEEWRAATAEWEANGSMGDAPKLNLFVPLKADCAGEGPDKCRQLPDLVKGWPGVTELPAGCDGAGEALNLNSPQIAGDADKLYSFMCMLPQWDQDFDGIGDKCDLCPYAFDPDNTLYKDQNNKVWPNYGKYCRGEWDPEAAPRLFFECGAEAPAGADTDTGTDTGTTGGMGTSG